MSDVNRNTRSPLSSASRSQVELGPPHLRDTTITAETASVIVLIWSNLRLFTADNHCASVPLRRRNGGHGHGNRSGALEGLVACHGKGRGWDEGGVGWGDGEGTGPATREKGRCLCPLYRSSPCFLPGQICKGSMHWRPYLLLQSCPIQECHRRSKGAHHCTFVPKWVTRITCGQNNYLCYRHDSNFVSALHWINLFIFYSFSFCS